MCEHKNSRGKLLFLKKVGAEALHLNRTQLLVLSFFALAWVSLVAILVAAPEIYGQALQLSPGNRRLFDFAFLVAVSAFIVILAVGVLRR